MKVYVVESGAHESYLIHGIFSTHEKAQAFVDSARPFENPYNRYDIQDIELDTPIPEGTLLALGY